MKMGSYEKSVRTTLGYVSENIREIKERLQDPAISASDKSLFSAYLNNNATVFVGCCAELLSLKPEDERKKIMQMNPLGALLHIVAA